MNFPFRNLHSKTATPKLTTFNINNLLIDKRRSEYIKGFYTARHLQCTLKDGSIPYSLAHIEEEGWLVGDESGKIWCRDSVNDSEDPFYNVVKFDSGVSEISPLSRSKVLFGEMRGDVTLLDFNNLSKDTTVSIKGISEKAPVKCIRWQPNHEEIFVTASQSGNLQFTDLRYPDKLIGYMVGPHNLNNPSNSRSTATGLVFHPTRPELFYTSGTPDNSVKLWDMRKLSDYTSISKAPVKRTRKNYLNLLSPVEEFSTLSYTARKHRSSVSLAIDSNGSRLFLATSNDNIFEFLTCNSEIGPVASYTAPVYKSCSFFSSISLDPTDRFLLSGSSSGQALIWDTSSHENYGTYELPVCAQLEVSKVAWANGTRGSLDAQFACISDDKTFSLFDWGLDDSVGIKRPKLCEGETRARERIHRDDLIIESKQPQIISYSPSNSSSIPVTPRKKNQMMPLIRTPQSANKSILDFFVPSPRVDPNFSQ